MDPAAGRPSLAATAAPADLHPPGWGMMMMPAEAADDDNDIPSHFLEQFLAYEEGPADGLQLHGHDAYDDDLFGFDFPPPLLALPQQQPQPQLQQPQPVPMAIDPALSLSSDGESSSTSTSSGLESPARRPPGAGSTSDTELLRLEAISLYSPARQRRRPPPLLLPVLSPPSPSQSPSPRRRANPRQQGPPPAPLLTPHPLPASAARRSNRLVEAISTTIRRAAGRGSAPPANPPARAGDPLPIERSESPEPLDGPASSSAAAAEAAAAAAAFPARAFRMRRGRNGGVGGSSGGVQLHTRNGVPMPMSLPMPLPMSLPVPMPNMAGPAGLEDPFFDGPSTSSSTAAPAGSAAGSSSPPPFDPALFATSYPDPSLGYDLDELMLMSPPRHDWSAAPSAYPAHPTTGVINPAMLDAGSDYTNHHHQHQHDGAVFALYGGQAGLNPAALVHQSLLPYQYAFTPMPHGGEDPVIHMPRPRAAQGAVAADLAAAAANFGAASDRRPTRPPRAPSTGARHHHHQPHNTPRRRCGSAGPSPCVSPTKPMPGQPMPSSSSSLSSSRHSSGGSTSSSAGAGHGGYALSSTLSTSSSTAAVRKRRSLSRGRSRSSAGLNGGGGAGGGGGWGGALDVGFVNYTPNDAGTLMMGVAPSGSAKTKARRDREAEERRRRLGEAAMNLVKAAGGDVEKLIDGGLV